MHVLTNQLPSFVAKDEATLDRIIVIPYLNKFPGCLVDASFKTKMLEKKDLIFSYIMKYGVIRDKFDLTDEIKVAKQEYVEDNNEDLLQDFIDERIDFSYNEEGKIGRDDFVSSYNAWRIQKQLKADTRNSKKFTRDMKNIYKIDNKKSNGKTYYLGIDWKVSEEEEK